MTTDQYEAEVWFHLAADLDGMGSYGGYREGARPPHADTQGRGRFTVSFCMEPPVWARAVLTNMGLTRQSSSRPTYDGAWTVWPEFANNVDPDQNPAIPTMTYDDLVDLWVTWPLLDFRGPFKASVPEEFVAALAGLAELYHNTPPAERAPATAVVNEIYAFLRALPLEGVPANLPPDFVPNNPDFIYDLFIRGSE